MDVVLVVSCRACRAKCRSCGKDVQGLVARMKQHYQQCSLETTQATEESPLIGNHTPAARKRAASPQPTHHLSPVKRQKHSSHIDQFVMKTSTTMKAQLDLLP